MFTMNAPAGMIAAATVRRLISACMDLYAGGVMHACVTCTYAAWSYCDKGSLCAALPCPIMVHHADLHACESCVGTTVILCLASLAVLSSFQKCLPPDCCKMNHMSLDSELLILMMLCRFAHYYVATYYPIPICCGLSLPCFGQLDCGIVP
jgi:hypothetical protein